MNGASIIGGDSIASADPSWAIVNHQKDICFYALENGTVVIAKPTGKQSTELLIHALITVRMAFRS